VSVSEVLNTLKMLLHCYGGSYWYINQLMAVQNCCYNLEKIYVRVFLNMF